MGRVGGADRAAVCAEGFERGDRIEAGFEEGGCRLADADAAGDEGADADHRHEGVEHADEATQAVDRIFGAAMAQAFGFPLRVEVVLEGGCRLWLEDDAVGGTEQRAGLQLAGFAQGFDVDDDARLEHAGLADAIGLAHKDRAEFDIDAAEGESVADLDAEIAGEARAAGDSPDIAGADDDVGRGDSAVEGEGANEGKGAVDAADIYLGDLVAVAGHQVGLGCLADGSALIEPGAFLDGGGALGYLDRRIAAEQRARLLCEPGLQRIGDRSGGGDGPGAERETGEVDPEAGNAAGEFAHRDAEPGDGGLRLRHEDG